MSSHVIFTVPFLQDQPAQLRRTAMNGLLEIEAVSGDLSSLLSVMDRLYNAEVAVPLRARILEMALGLIGEWV